MRGTVAIVVLAVLALAAAVAWHEFAVGLQGYGILQRDGELGTWSVSETPDGVVLLVSGPPDDRPLTIPLPSTSFTLEFETLAPGPLGRLFGVGPLVKLSGVGMGAEGGTIPLHGGTDACWQILDLTGVLGSLVARPARISLPREAGPGTAGHIVVRQGRPELTTDAAGS